jgi:hypothetical protein
MSQDFPNTVLMWESTRDEGSRFDEIFEPDVKVLLSWKDVEAAVEVGAVVPSEAYSLWAYWASPGSPARLAAQAVLQPQADPSAKAATMSAGVATPGNGAAPTASPSAGVNHEPLEMKLPGQHKEKQGVPSEMRVVLLVVAGAVVVWAVGKALAVW